MPLVHDGPIRHFYERLHDLHLAAGRPSMRQLQRASRGQLRPTGINPTTIHAAFAAPRLARWEVVGEVVRLLDGDVDEFSHLWRRARQAEDAGAGSAQERPPAEGAAHRAAVQAGGPVPRELPADVFAFTGRGDQLKQLDGWLPADGAPVAIAAIVGMAGVGKTALAVHWGHGVRDQFPDGQLYVNLRGSAHGEPTPPIKALSQFMRSLGLPAEEIPAEEESAAARYRSLLADRRVLVVLDNAADAAQVRPLLPASPGCLVLVTSRSRLAGLVARDGARLLALDVLDAGEAYDLLARVLGTERVAGESAAAAELTQACSYLPLALRLAAATLTYQPRRPIADHAASLRRDSLATLDVDDHQSGIRSVFDLSYRALPPDVQRLFRLSGLVPGPDLTPAAAAALGDTTEDHAGQLLERLAAAHLLTPHVPDRYSCHDLLRQYAADLANSEDTAADRQVALGRLLAWYLQGADAAAMLAYPQRMRLPVPPATRPGPAHKDDDAALAWLDAERGNLLAAIEHAAEHGPHPTAWLLADTLRSYFWLRMHTVDLSHATDAALRAAEADDDPRAQAITLLSLSNIHFCRRDYALAITHSTRALALAERVGWAEGQASALGILATAHRDAGEMAKAVEVYGRSLTLYRTQGSGHGEALALHHLGRTYLYLGRITEAIDSSTRALELYQEAGSRHGEALALDCIGEIWHTAGQLDDARRYLDRALALARDIGDCGPEAFTLRNLAAVHRDLGQPVEALDLARSAMMLAHEIGDIRIEADAINTLATVHHHLGHHPDAMAQHQRALDLVAPTADPYPEIEAHLGMATTCRHLGRIEPAREHADHALATAQRTGFRILEERARTILDRLGEDSPAVDR
jgi:tetratricopeptide (TPR) repeat protein